MSIKTQGCDWESRFDEECKYHGVDYMPIGRDIYQNGSFRAPKGLFDRVLFFEGKAAFIDLKSLKNTENIKYSDLDHEQLKLLQIGEMNGHKSGNVVWFIKQDIIMFYWSSQLLSITPQTSIDASEGEYLGSYKDFALGNLFLPFINRFKLI